MANVTIDFGGFEELQKRINELNGPEIEVAKTQSVKDMAAVYLREAKANTPVGKHISVKIGKRRFTGNTEHMRRSWGAGTVEKDGKDCKIKIFNSASYASYVNDGHRQQPGRYVPILGKQLVKNWVDGLNMAEKAEAETEKAAKRILRRNINRALERYGK